MSKATGLWNAAKEAYRAAKGLLSKNERNAATAQAKKERGPVKAFFHITKNENVPAIEQQGLLTNHPNANINSANHPFRKHGTDAGGVWVTTEPTAFPVYGTTIGGKNGNSAARADALSTFKIEVPLPELPKIKAVQDPYGKNILRKGDDPRAVEKFRTWAGIDVPTTVFLDNIKPVWLKNIGYVEEAPALNPTLTLPTLHDVPSGWALSRRDDNLRWLDKNRLKEYAGFTGHRHGKGSYDKSPQRFVNEYIDKNQPITKRQPIFPGPSDIHYTAYRQGANLDHPLQPNEIKRYSADFIPARRWSEGYWNYIKPGESSLSNQRQFEFAPGAVSRGMGGANLPPIEERHFDWNRYKRLVAEGETPEMATYVAAPKVALNWDNIVYRNGEYIPEFVVKNAPKTGEGSISRGMSKQDALLAQINQKNRRMAAEKIRQAKQVANEYLSRFLGRQPTAEEVDNWARAGVFNDIESGNIDAPAILGEWSDKADWNIVDRLSEELGGK